MMYPPDMMSHYQPARPQHPQVSLDLERYPPDRIHEYQASIGPNTQGEL